MHCSRTARRTRWRLAALPVLSIIAILFDNPAQAQSCQPPPPQYGAEFGDAPEGQIAYHDTGIGGMFPTCVGGPTGCMQHARIPMGPLNNTFFGPDLDYEQDGNGGLCPPPIRFRTPVS